MGLRRILISALVVLTSACGGHDASVADPPIRSGPSSSPTQTPHRESPEHFIRRWAAEDTRIQRTGDTTKFRQMSQGCAGCMRLASLVERIYAHGGFIHTRGWQIRKISAADEKTFDLYVFTTVTDYAPSRNSSVRHLPSGSAHFQLRLAHRGSGWRVTYLIQVAT